MAPISRSFIEGHAPTMNAPQLDLADRQHGVVSTRQLRAAGLSLPSIRWLCTSREWDDLGHGVLRRAGTGNTLLQRIMAVVLQSGHRSAASHATAGWLWGLEGCAPTDPIHVIRDSGRAGQQVDGALIHRVRSLPPRWVTEHQGIPVVRPELLAINLFAVSSFEVAERRVDSLWASRLLSGRSLGRCLEELGASGRNGVAGLRRYLETRGDAYEPPESGVESRTVQILSQWGFEFRRQVNIVSDGLWCGRVDLVAVDEPVIIEVQSTRYHSSLTDVTADAARLQRLEAAGYRVVEVWDHEVWQRPNVVVDRVRAAILAARSRRNP